MNANKWRRLEINGGLVSAEPHWRLQLPPVANGYADAQIDDYGPQTGRRRSRRRYPWRPGAAMRLRARFSHRAGELLGTAGFGFWNAPFGDPTVPSPALPQATWFFYASEPSDLPLAADGPGRGWFASTLDATTPRAWALIPAAPLALLLNQSIRLRQRFWPFLRRQLGISFAPIPAAMTDWHEYELRWLADGCAFLVDGEPVLQTPFSPRGPLGFVCWLDNQTMVLTVNGRFRWNILPIPTIQWLEVVDLTIAPMDFPGNSEFPGK
ncbi:MAG: hypothetical protein GY803_01730 [Chloroflexi bacterium]|nr:hypothetical protein [Chloroflexota bacterium]